MSTEDPIVHDSIFEEDEFSDLHVPKVYRIIGYIRLCWVIAVILYVLLNVLPAINFDKTPLSLFGNILGIGIFIVLLSMLMIYHIKQLKEEIKLSQHIIDDRKFRLRSIILQMLFSTIALLKVISSNSNLRIEIKTFIFLLVLTFTITILVVDLDYYIKLRKKS